MLVHEVVLDQRPHELGAARDQDDAFDLLFEFCDLLAGSPPRMVELFQSAVVSVDDTTYLGMLFIFSPNAPVPSIVGQAAANPS